MTPIDTDLLMVHVMLAVCVLDAGFLTTWINVRPVTAVPVSVPVTNAPLTPPQVLVIEPKLLVFAIAATSAARFDALVIVNDGVVILILLALSICAVASNATL